MPSSPANRLRNRFNVAQAMHQRGRLAEAEAIYQEILRLDPRHVDALHFLGVMALQTHRTDHGVRLIEKAVTLKPNYAQAYGNLGIGYADLRRYHDALTSYDRALALKPDLAEVHDNRGNALGDLGRYQEAVASYDKAIALRPDYAEALSNRGNALYNLQRYEEALASYDKAIGLQSGFVEAHCNRGIVLRALSRHEEALRSFDKAIALAPGHAEAHNSRGNALQDVQRHEEALTSFTRAILLKPSYVDAYINQGNALQDLRRYEDALASCENAIAMQPEHAQAHYNRGNALMALQRHQDALASFASAITLNPVYAEAHHNSAVALVELQQCEAALRGYDRAIELRPDYAEALTNRGTALRILRRYKEALDSYEKAMAVDPDTKWLLGDLLFSQQQICYWPAEKSLLVTMAERIKLGQEVTLPFPMLTFSVSPELQRKAAEIFVRRRYPASNALPTITKYAEHAKIRVGYFSADFYDHATMHLMIDLFDAHDRSRFELTAFSFGPDVDDEMRQRVVGVFDRFVDVSRQSDREVALLARSLEIDIAVDLKGFTTGCRSGIFSSRAAPVQVNYLGYPGTMGAGYIDYIIADPTLIPDRDARHFSESIVYLPDTYQVNQRNRPVSLDPTAKTEHGLPEAGFVFCCFNNNYKITSRMFDCWMRLLQTVDGSVLWLLEESADAAANLRREAFSRGVAEDRLIFAPRRPLADHLARHRLADLFLDTLPYNAHTTASDALWAGLPVLTQIGETFAGRVAASLLLALDLPELVTTTSDDYAALAIKLAMNPDELRTIRTKLENHRLSRPLFDTERFARNLELAFTAMYKRVQDELAPASIRVGEVTTGGC